MVDSHDQRQLRDRGSVDRLRHPEVVVSSTHDCSRVGHSHSEISRGAAKSWVRGSRGGTSGLQLDGETDGKNSHK